MAGVLKVVTFMVLVFDVVVVFAENHYVGGDGTIWERPKTSDYYSNWAANKIFPVGDELEFVFDHMRHDVAIVTKDAYENCNKENPIKVIKTSPTKIKLDTTGPQYFICTLTDDCRWGQKFEINVVGVEGVVTPGKGSATPGDAGSGAIQTPGASPGHGVGATQAPGTSPSAGGGAIHGMKWDRPKESDFYSNWAAGKVFHVGDELEFEFDHMRHDVAIVTKEAYENCNKENPIRVVKTSPAKIKLDTTGPQYFICTLTDDCRWGQKLEINVVGATQTPGGSPNDGAGATQAPKTCPSVGGGAIHGMKWDRPKDSDFYSTWAADKDFHVGDELEFEFDQVRHDVAIVTKEAYENCNKENPIKVIKTSPTKIKLDTTGPQYFICTLTDDCRWGQKLEINVVGVGDVVTPGKGSATPGHVGSGAIHGMKWDRPKDSEFYSNWAVGKVFHVGDELEFEFDHMRHDVAIVTKDAYENCNKEKPIRVVKTSPAKIKLDTIGPQYFICTLTDDCRWGQKLEINVVGVGGDATPGKDNTTPGDAGSGATQILRVGTQTGTAPGTGLNAEGGVSETPRTYPTN